MSTRKMCVFLFRMKRAWRSYAYRTSFDWYTNCDWEPLKFDVNVNRRVATHTLWYKRERDRKKRQPILNWLRCPFQCSMKLCVFTADWHNNLLNSHGIVFLRCCCCCWCCFEYSDWHCWMAKCKNYNKKTEMNWNGRRSGGDGENDNGNGTGAHI